MVNIPREKQQCSLGFDSIVFVRQTFREKGKLHYSRRLRLVRDLGDSFVGGVNGHKSREINIDSC
jgi:hypothetical protein